MITAFRVVEPFPGLRPFTVDESELFFGRDDQVEELLLRLAIRRFLAVVGTSGSGKSSLVRAGLIPTIQRGHLGPPGSQWVMATVGRPGLDPLHGLASSLTSAFGLPESTAADIETGLAKSSRGLDDVALAHLHPDQRLLILVDQFEELFRYRSQSGSEGRVKSTAFVKLLLHATGQAGLVQEASAGPIYVVLTMRSDYLGKCAQFRGLPEALNDAQFLVPQMSRDQLREAIEGPVSLAGAAISDELVDRLLNDVGDNPDMLPVLQHALRRIWEVSGETRGQHQPMDLSHYEDKTIGGISQALHLDAEAAFEALKGAEEQGIARRTFQRLVEPGTEDEESRRPTRLSELASVCRAPEERVRDVLAVFLRRSFLTLSADPNSLVDISHESLIRLWQRLKRWVSEESQSAAVYRRLSDDASRRRSLYRGPSLAEAVTWQKSEAPNADWAARYVSDPGAFEKALRFLRLSRFAQLVERGLFITGVLLVGVMAVTFYSLYRNAEEQKRVAEGQKRLAMSRQLAADALLSRSTQSDRALLLSIEAYRAAPTYEARSALLGGVQNSLGLRMYLHQEAPEQIAFSPDGKLLAAAGRNGTILWDVAAASPLGEPLRGHEGPVYSVAFNPNGKTLASGGSDGTVRLWDVTTHRPLGNPMGVNEKDVEGLAFSSDGRILAASARDTVRFWDGATGHPLGEPLHGNKYGFSRFAFSPKRPVLAFACGLTVQLWDLPSRSFLSPPLQADSIDVNSVAFSPDGTKVVSAGVDGILRLWDASTGRTLGKLTGKDAGMVESVAYSPDGSLLASGDYEKTVRLWDAVKRRSLGEPLWGHTLDLTSVAFSPDGLTLATAGRDNTILLWDVATLVDLRKERDLPRAPIIPLVTLSPDAKTLAAGNPDGTVLLLDAANHLPFGYPLRGHTAYVDSIVFSPDGKVLATSSFDKTVRVWDAHTGLPLGGPLEYSAGVGFSPDGTTLLIATDKTVILWDVATRRLLGKPIEAQGSQISSADFSPDGRTLAVANGSEVRFLDVNTRQPEGAALHGHSGDISFVQFSPDGKTLVTASADDNFLRLWDVATRRPQGEPLQGAASFASVIAFSPDGKTLASADQYALHLWDVAMRRPLGEPMKQPSHISSMEFSPDSKTLITAYLDRTVRRWNLDPDSAITRVCSIVNRNLSLSEWNQEIGQDIPYRKTCPALPPGEGAPQ